MNNYDNRLKEAWERVPSHRQKSILEELERKAYKQDFEVNNEENKVYSTVSSDNPLEPIADVIVDALGGVGVLWRCITGTYKK